MARVDYWDESLGYALEAIDCFDVLTREQRREVAESLASSAENESLDRGPTPSARDLENTEIARIKRLHAAEIADLQRQIATYQNSVARRRNVDPSRIYFSGTDVMIAS